MPLRMFELKNILHELFIYTGWRPCGIGDVQTDFHLIHRRIEHADMERLLFAMCFSREENPSMAHTSRKNLLPILRFSCRQAASRAHGVASNGQRRPAELSGRFLREQRGERCLRNGVSNVLGNSFPLTARSINASGRSAPAQHAVLARLFPSMRTIAAHPGRMPPSARTKRQQFEGVCRTGKTAWRSKNAVTAVHICSMLYHLVVIFSMQRSASS